MYIYNRKLREDGENVYVECDPFASRLFPQREDGEYVKVVLERLPGSWTMMTPADSRTMRRRGRWPPSSKEQGAAAASYVVAFTEVGRCPLCFIPLFNIGSYMTSCVLPPIFADKKENNCKRKHL